ncbi:hypothetical protein FJR38_26240 [Anabaena sp. UHCC 0253]|uniref:hypothetical protein n=1 Tax=Anabaena sp. UHCC 0253 TaxID=2590019 RepID=UPI0014486C32|nr:hypothetical protein [Anabaena sp. UHCC 0253]MTJ55907.1 hypothetical protein [Anabaena sp. UHCC 0253]
MMEFQETNNSQPETSGTDNTPDPNQPPQESNTTGETPEADTPVNNEITNSESSTTSEQTEYNKNSSPNSEGNDDARKESLESLDTTKERFLDKKPIGLLGRMGMLQGNERIYNNLGEVLDWLNDISSGYQLHPQDINGAWDDTKAALDLMARLLDDLGKYRQDLSDKEESNKLLKQENRQLKKDNQDWKESYYSLEERLRNTMAEKDNLSRIRQNSETNYIQQIQNLRQELSRKIDTSHQQIDKLRDEVALITKEKQGLEKNLAELEASKGKLLAEVASVKRNTGTHYDGTSDRPQHHVLTGEYKTLKEQHLDPLANSLFKLMVTSNPELKQQRREKVNDIKADISAIVLIGGQAMMRGESTSSIELPSGMLNEMQNLFCQKLPIFDINQLPQVSELLTKAANLAQGKVQYPVPGKWQEDDFKQAIRELTEKLCQKLHFNFTSLNQDIQTEIQQSINNALIFLQRANLADSPAFLSLDSEGAPFRFNYHEAAKGYDDEGKIIKAIYPVYLVNSEAKVKAIVLTEPTTTGQRNPDIAPNSIRYETLSLTGTSSTSLVSATKSSEINEDEKEKIISQGILKGKRESLIKNVRTKFIDVQFYYGDKNSDNALLEKLANITSLEIIEQLEDEFLKAYQLKQFQEKVTYLVG